MANKKRLEKGNPQAAATATVEAGAADQQKSYSAKRLLPLMLVLALAAVAVYAHLRVGDAEDYTGILAPLARVFDLLLALSLVGAAFCAGRAVARRLALDFTSFAEEVAFSIMLGTGAVGLLVFALGMLGLFKPLPVALLFVLLLAVTRRELLLLFTNISAVTKRNLFTGDRRTIALLFIALLALLTLRAALPPHAVDEAIYHLAAPKDFVDAGRIYPLYDNFSGNMPLLAHMFYVVCLIAKADIAARLFSLALAVTTAVALYAFGARFFSRKMGALAMFGFFGAGMVMEVSVTTRVDVTLAGMGFIALYAMMNYFSTDKRGWLWASALLSGFSLGIKYTAGAWVALMGALFLYESLIAKRQRLVTVFTRGALFCAIALAVFSPWVIKNYAYFKSPVYPFVTGEVAEYSDDGARFFTAADERKMQGYFEQSEKEIPQIVNRIKAQMAEAEGRRVERHPFRFWEFFTDPDRYNMGAAEGNHGPNYLFLVAPLFLLLPKRRWVVWLVILSAAFFCFVAATAWIARYYLPIYPALTLIAAYALVTLAEKLKEQAPIAKILPAAAVATTVALTAFVFALQFHVSGGASYLAGRLSRREFLQAAFYYPAVDFLNRNTPNDAKVMLVGAQMGYHLQRDYLAEVGWDAVEWQRLMIRNDSLAGMYEDLKRQGITHVLYSPGLFVFVAETGREGSGPSGVMYRGEPTAETRKDYYAQLRTWATFEHFRLKYLETLESFKTENTEYVVLKVK